MRTKYAAGHGEPGHPHLGASIAGPALAYWLRSQGFSPTVVERAPAPRPGGQTVGPRAPAAP
jgi:2-polyprenyl-6-methoxyphenol hydroxylase-like FAD-dependent oxidoreductase